MKPSLIHICCTIGFSMFTCSSSNALLPKRQIWQYTHVSSNYTHLYIIIGNVLGSGYSLIHICVSLYWISHVYLTVVLRSPILSLVLLCSAANLSLNSSCYSFCFCIRIKQCRHSTNDIIEKWVQRTNSSNPTNSMGHNVYIHIYKVLNLSVIGEIILNDLLACYLTLVLVFIQCQERK